MTHSGKRKKVFIMCQCVVPMPHLDNPVTEKFICGFCGGDVYQVPGIRNLMDHPKAKSLRFIFVCPACESDALVNPQKYLDIKGFNFIDLSNYTDEHAGQVLQQLTQRHGVDSQ